MESRELVLCAGTVPRASFRQRVEAAAGAGFAGISLFLDDYYREREAGRSDAELRGLLADHGLVLTELEPLLVWLPGSDALGEQGPFRYRERDFLTAGEALGARALTAVALGPEPLGTERIAEAFGGLCDRAAARGLRVHLEFLPWTELSDAEAALAVVETADHPAGGLLLDTWHHFRSGSDARRLAALPGARIGAVQLSDAPRAPEADPADETLHRRLLPGEGDIDLVGIVRALDAVGCRTPLGVEVFSDALAQLPPDDAARRAADAARRVLGELQPW